MILAIYGAGGLGREVLQLAQEINNKDKRWQDFVFVDDYATETSICGINIYSYEDLKANDFEAVEFSIGLGEPLFRSRLKEKVEQDGYSLATLVHPSAHITDTTKFGAGCIVCYNAFVSIGVNVGDNVLIQPMASIGHDDIIGENSVISSFVTLAGHVTIGKCTYIGMSVPVREGLTIGEWSIVGMGSSVLRDIEKESIALGNPARVMQKNTDRRVFK